MADESTYNQNLSLDEIVFENRNKEYGAYDIRTAYRGLLTKSFLIGTLLFLVLALSPFIYLKIQQMNKKEAQAVDAKLIDVKLDDKPLEQPKEKEPPPPPPPPKVEPPKQEVIQNVVPEPKKAPKVETPPPPISKTLDTQTGLQNQEGVKTPAYTPPPPPPNTGTKASTAEVKAPVNTNEVYDSVDQSAEYPGGLNGVRSFISDNFDNSGMEGEGKLTAKIKFIVERDGSVSDVKIVSKSGNSDFDAESVRVVKKLKKWAPGKKNGENVRSYYSIPVSMQFE